MTINIKIPLQDFEIAYKSNLLRENNITANFFTYFSKHIQIESCNHQFWKMEFVDYRIQSAKAVFVGAYKEILFTIQFTPPVKANIRDFIIHYDAVLHEISNHQALVYVHSDWENGVHNSSQQIGIIELDVPTNRIYPLHIVLEKGSMWKGFKSMVRLGIQHISEGTDHLLFLIVLLLTAPLLSNGKSWVSSYGTKRSIIRIFKITTAFTIGHSITLLIGTLGIIYLNIKWVEVLIAFSIFVTAIHAIKPIFPEKEIYIAGAFGLVHGLAFASVLSNLQLETNNLILSLLGFNIGIELMQVFVIALVMPWLLLLSNYQIYKVLRVLCAVVAGIASIAWAIERFTGNPNLISNQLLLTPSISLVLVFGLAFFAIGYRIIIKLRLIHFR